MRYFIGYLFEGEARNYLEEISEDISQTFGTRPLHRRTPPHLTLYRPFETEDIRLERQILSEWSSKAIATPFNLEGFGRFTDRVIFVDANVDMYIKGLVEDLQHSISKIPGMPQESGRPWRPHATLVKREMPEKIEWVWKYLSELPKPQFDLNFDAVTLFRFEQESGWLVEEEWKLGG